MESCFYSPRFSITISDLYSSVTKMSPTGTSVVDKKALGPIPSPAKCNGNLESLQEMLQKATHEYYKAAYGLNVTVIVISELGQIDP